MGNNQTFKKQKKETKTISVHGGFYLLPNNCFLDLYSRILHTGNPLS